MTVKSMLMPVVWALSVLVAAEPPGRDAIHALAEAPAIEREMRAEAMLRGQDPAARRVIIERLAQERISGIDRVYDQALDDADRGVQAAALTAVAAVWPTCERHLQRLRRDVSARDPQIAAAAIAAVGHLRDDRASDALRQCLDGDPALRAAAHAALTTIHGRDLGSDRAAWDLAVLRRRTELAPIFERATHVFAGKDTAAIRATVLELVQLRDERSAVAELLAPLLNHPDQTVARLAQSGLAQNGSGVALLYLTRRAVADPIAPPQRQGTTVVAADAVRALRVIEPDHSGRDAVLALASFLGVVAWILFRSPVKDVPAVAAATKRFTRAIRNSPEYRAMEAAGRKIQSTRVYRAGAAATRRISRKVATSRVVRTVSASPVYQALAVKPASDTVRIVAGQARKTVQHATSVIRRKRS